MVSGNLATIRPCGDFILAKNIVLTPQDIFIRLDDIFLCYSNHEDWGMYVRYQENDSWAYVYNRKTENLYILLFVLTTIKQKDSEGNIYLPPITKELIMEMLDLR